MSFIDVFSEGQHVAVCQKWERQLAVLAPALRAAAVPPVVATCAE